MIKAIVRMAATNTTILRALARRAMRPLEAYYDVKIVIAESELLSVHHFAFVSRPYDFSSDIRRRILPACVFTRAL